MELRSHAPDCPGDFALPQKDGTQCPCDYWQKMMEKGEDPNSDTRQYVNKGMRVFIWQNGRLT